MSERVWALAVVSSAPQELSVEEQDRWARETAAANGWTLEHVRSGVSSGKAGMRPLVEDLLDEIRSMPKASRPARLLAVRLDRLGRGTGIEVIGAIAELRKLGCSVYTRDRGAVTIQNATDALGPFLDSIMAARENEVRSDRAKAGKARRRAAGLHNGNPPYGCILVEGRPVAYEPEAVLTREIFERRARGWGYDRLSRFAAERAIPKLLISGRTRKLGWGVSSVQRLIWNRTLRGVAVTPELWDEANAIAGISFKERRQSSWSFPLSGALRCTCGQMMRGQSSGRRSKNERFHPYYVCRRPSVHDYYPHHRAASVEADFVSLLRRLTAEPQLLDPSQRYDVDALRTRLSQAQDELDAVERQRTLIWERAEDLTGLQLRERLDEIDVARAKVAEIYAETRSELMQAEAMRASARTLSETLESLADSWTDAPLGLKQESARAVAALLGGLYLEPAPKIEQTARKRGQLVAPSIITGFEYAAAAALSENDS